MPGCILQSQQIAGAKRDFVPVAGALADMEATTDFRPMRPFAKFSASASSLCCFCPSSVFRTRRDNRCAEVGRGHPAEMISTIDRTPFFTMFTQNHARERSHFVSREPAHTQTQNDVFAKTRRMHAVPFLACVKVLPPSFARCAVFAEPFLIPHPYLPVLSMHASVAGWVPQWTYIPDPVVMEMLQMQTCSCWIHVRLHPAHHVSMTQETAMIGIDLVTGLPTGVVFVVDGLVRDVPNIWVPSTPSIVPILQFVSQLESHDSADKFIADNGTRLPCRTTSGEPQVQSSGGVVGRVEFAAMFEWAVLPFLGTSEIAAFHMGLLNTHIDVVGMHPVCAWRWFMAALNVCVEAVDRMMWILRCQQTKDAVSAFQDVCQMPDRIQMLVATATELLLHAPQQQTLAYGGWLKCVEVESFVETAFPECTPSMFRDAVAALVKPSTIVPGVFTNIVEKYAVLSNRVEHIMHKPILASFSNMMTTAAFAAQEFAFIRLMKQHITKRPPLFDVPCPAAAMSAMRRHCASSLQLTISDEQLRHTLSLIGTSSCAFLCGPAGSGKTTIAQLLHYVCSLRCQEIKLRNRFTSSGSKCWPMFVPLAASAAAASRLQDVLNAHAAAFKCVAHTWHWYITYAGHHAKQTSPNPRPIKLFDNNVPKVFLLDESGMQDTQLATRMIQCILQNTTDSQIWFLGDGNQLKPITPTGHFFRSATVASACSRYVHTLRTVFRSATTQNTQHALSNLLQEIIAPACGEGNRPAHFLRQLDRCTTNRRHRHTGVHDFVATGVHWYPICATSGSAIAASCVQWASSRIKNEQMDTVILCARRFVRFTGVCALNRAIQQRIHADKTYFFTCNRHPDMYTDTPPVLLYTGDKVDYIDNRTHLRTQLMGSDGMSDIPNGTDGMVITADPTSVTIQFNTNGGPQIINLRAGTTDTSHIWPAYVLTVQRMQGKECQHVILCVDRPQLKMLSRDLLYTACTRHRASLHIFIPRDGITCFLRLQQDNTNPGLHVSDRLLFSPRLIGRRAVQQKWHECIRDSMFWKIYDIL